MVGLARWAAGIPWAPGVSAGGAKSGGAGVIAGCAIILGKTAFERISTKTTNSDIRVFALVIEDFSSFRPRIVVVWTPHRCTELEYESRKNRRMHTHR